MLGSASDWRECFPECLLSYCRSHKAGLLIYTGLTRCLATAVSYHPTARLASSVSACVPLDVAGLGESQGPDPYLALAYSAVLHVVE